MASSWNEAVSGSRPLTSLGEAVEGMGVVGYAGFGGFSTVGLPGAANPALLAARLRDSGLRDARAPGWPVWLAVAAQRPGKGVLTVDAREACAGDHIAGRLIRSNPYGLAEALLLAAAALGRSRARLLVSPGREDLARLLDRCIEDARRYAAGVSLALEWTSLPSSPDFSPPALDPLDLDLGLQAWMLLPAALATGRAGTRLVCHDRAPVEAALGQDLRASLSEEGVLAFDEGLAGFAAAGAPLPLDPELLAARGLDPGFSRVRALTGKECPVDLTRQALYQHWRQAAVREGHPHRALLARTARLAAELALGRGHDDHLAQLAQAAVQLEEAGLRAACTLRTSLETFSAQWREHAAGTCSTGVCRARRVAPCQERCPSGIDIPNFLSLTGRGAHAEAVSVMVKDNPLPYACGLVCPAPCEKVCLRGKVDKPIHIRAMKAVSAKAVMDSGGTYPPLSSKAAPTGRKVAVVGGGPSGLACASFLLRRGHSVTILEAMPKLGGMLRYGIPEYRLPKAILDAEMATVTGLGAEVVTGKALGRDFTLDQLSGDGFDAVFLGLGAWSSRALGLEGERMLVGVVPGTEFLVELGLGRKPAIGRRVVVVGGGNTAMDCARTAVRLGAEEVRVVYRRSRAEMPAAVEEVEEAEHEGVQFTFLAAPTQLVGQDGKLAGMEVVTMALGEPDASGRRRPEPKAGTERVIPCDMIISAIGQFCDESFAQGDDGTLGEVCLTKWKTIQVEKDDLSTARKGVYAGGDAAMGPATVVEAIRDGKRAAAAIDAFLSGRPFDASEVEPRPRYERELLCSPHGCGWSENSRPAIPMIPVSARSLNFDQVEIGLDQAMAETEARRCLRCDVCIGCGLCQLVCSEAGGDALRFKEVEGRLVFEDFDRPTEKCVGCGACARICPTGAMSIVLEKGETAISFTGHSISEIETPSCLECGKPLPAGQYLEHLKKRMGEHLAGSARMDQELCPDCARQQRGVSFVSSMLK
ncbi:MAG: FAD-dependent oxidoreductase [Thermodesulfobacteriota bacterium]